MPTDGRWDLILRLKYSSHLFPVWVWTFCSLPRLQYYKLIHTRNYILEEIRIIFNVFKSVSTAIHSMFLLLGGKDFWHHFSTHLFHAQIVVQNLSNTFLIDVGKFRNCSNAQSAVSSNNSSDLLHILLSLRSGRTARFWIVPMSSLPSLNFLNHSKTCVRDRHWSP